MNDCRNDGCGTDDKRCIIYFDLQKIPQGNNQFRESQQDAEFQFSAPKAEIAFPPEKNRHDQHQQSYNNQPCDIVINLIQKRLLAANGLKHDSGYCCNGITQKKKAQRNKQRSKQHAV